MKHSGTVASSKTNQFQTMSTAAPLQASTTMTGSAVLPTNGAPRTSYGLTPIRELQHVFVKKEFFNPGDYEQTSSVFLPKQFRRLEPVNEKIELLKDQTGQMDVALEDMKKNREEAKKQLEARYSLGLLGFRMSIER
jgi:hypothetical protein